MLPMRRHKKEIVECDFVKCMSTFFPKIFSGIISKHVDNSDGGNIERLEMAHIKMEAAIETSNKCIAMLAKEIEVSGM
uniref:Uncharacterized protein n=1 Tax=Oryza punctata TaxID=4537 RepID=A0A0E0KM27_ORYPU